MHRLWRSLDHANSSIHCMQWLILIVKLITKVFILYHCASSTPNLTPVTPSNKVCSLFHWRQFSRGCTSFLLDISCISHQVVFDWNARSNDIPIISYGCYCNIVELILIVGRNVQFMHCLWHSTDSANLSRHRMKWLIFIMEFTKEFIFQHRTSYTTKYGTNDTLQNKECSHTTVVVTLVD